MEENNFLFPILDENNNSLPLIKPEKDINNNEKDIKIHHKHKHKKHHEKYHEKDEIIVSNDLFKIDTKGDEDNLFYGQSDISKIPKYLLILFSYHINRSNPPIGYDSLPSNIKYSISFKNHKKFKRYFNPSVISKITDKSHKRIHYEESEIRKRRLNEDMIVINSEYIPIPPLIDIKENDELKSVEEDILERQKKFSEV